MSQDLQDLSARLKQFAQQRDWAQFHAPKNLAAALIVEAGELLEHFQWMPEEESRKLGEDQLQRVRGEVADVFLYLVQLADALEIDLIAAANEKLVQNALKYPVEFARGSSRKYGDLGREPA